MAELKLPPSAGAAVRALLAGHDFSAARGHIIGSGRALMRYSNGGRPHHRSSGPSLGTCTASQQALHN